MMRTAIKKLLDLIYPEDFTCNACGRELKDDERELCLCTPCVDSLIPIRGNPVCFDTTAVFSVFRYAGVVRKYVLDNKDFGKPHLSRYIAAFLYKLFKKYDLKCDLICYVPSSPKSRKRRGYDPMRLIAEEFSKLTDIPVNHNLFRIEGVDLTMVDASERRECIKNKFLSRGGFCGDVILIDDVVTSGATISECANIILSHGAKSVIALTFAQAV